MKSSAGLQTRIGPSCEMTADSIRYHLKTLEDGTTYAPGRLILWRLIIRSAQDEYDRELQQLNDRNSIKSDPSLEVPVV